ncbi:4556_t:CDS:2 [Paraglomus occultum]|uniref:4556_t:CDS:1 n=1 Tax=Paraglomus occultum TaxID=144539 RepID=A0A9N9D4R1_9GLOM|nr:4556_t:CDS:2 [Paraglomus occultum]
MYGTKTTSRNISQYNTLAVSRNSFTADFSSSRRELWAKKRERHHVREKTINSANEGNAITTAASTMPKRRIIIPPVTNNLQMDKSSKDNIFESHHRCMIGLGTAKDAYWDAILETLSNDVKGLKHGLANSTTQALDDLRGEMNRP